MKVLITGCNGQLGTALQKTASQFHRQAKSLDVYAMGRDQLDLSQPQQIITVLKRIAPDVIINAAAYTAVDRAEADAASAQAINADAVGIMSQWCADQAALMIQVSTDFVFDGCTVVPYTVDAITNPLSVYGTTKLAGEVLLRATGARAYIIRTGWVYSEDGANFVKTMLRLAGEREQLNVVCDQIGTPTYAMHLATMIWRLLEVQPTETIWHFSDAGVASWYDLAQAVFDEAHQLGIISKVPQLRPIATSAYPTPARRPPYSVLNKDKTWETLSITPIHWRAALIGMLANYKNQQDS